MRTLAVLFDFDGTLTKPGTLDFAFIRQALGCPHGQPVLEFINSLPSEKQRTEAKSILDRFEMEAASRSQPNEGAEDLLDYIKFRKLKLGIISRNSAAAIYRALANFTRIGAAGFDVIISRDDASLPKPSPEAVLLAARRMGVTAESILMVGDFVYDVEAGRWAGARTVFLTNEGSPPPCTQLPDYIVGRLPEIRKIIELTAPLAAGKLPNPILGQFLAQLEIAGESLLIAPGIGEDIAAVPIANEEILVLKSDPVTLATDAIGHYAVVVNVNDVATSGATPRWLLTTLLFPVGTAAEEILHVMRDLQALCRQNDLFLCGGHTEITDAVTRPIVVAQVAGTVQRERLIDKRNMREGDHILLTKGVAIEGTCILAREFPQKLRELGMTSGEIEKCRGFLTNPGISIRKEAEIAASSGKVTAMHDVTEGGLSTALEELSIAGRHRIRVFADRIPILDETAKIGRLLGIRPLGLIGSGSLLICCAAGASDSLIQSIRMAGIEATWIGEILEEGTGIEAVNDAREKVPWLSFEVDEVARLFESSK